MFIEYGSPADALDRPCPFGGSITVHAYANDAFAVAGRQYRAMWRPSGSTSNGTPVTGPFVTGFFPVVTRTPDPTTGFTPYLSTALNPFGPLAAWQTSGVVVDGRYEIRLEMVDAAMNPYRGHTRGTPSGSTTPPRLRTSRSRAGRPATAPTPATSCRARSRRPTRSSGSSAWTPCRPASAPPNPTHTPASTTSPVTNGSWELATTVDWLQCGYVVEIHVYDRSIVNSVPWQKNYNHDDIGFCLGL